MGVLRTAIPKGITIRKSTAMVLALAKIHNFCIDQTDTNVLPMTAMDKLTLMTNQFGSVTLDVSTRGEENNGEEVLVPGELIGGGDHFEDVLRAIRQI